MEYRAQRKAGQKIDQGLDSVLAVPKKVSDKKKAKKNSAGHPAEDQNTSASPSDQQSSNEDKPGNSLNAQAEDPNDMSPKDGYITLALSANTVFAGGSILFTGAVLTGKTCL